MSIYQRLRIRIRAKRYLRKSESCECCFALACLRAGMNAIDIGAHKAAYTYWMSRRVGKTGQVLAFEPVPVLASYLQKYARSYGKGNIHVCPIALSDKTGDTQLRIFRDDYCWSTLQYESTEVGKPHTDFSYVQVPMDTLDHHLDLMAAKRPIGFIKCDVEGHERAVLSGARRTLQQDRPVILLESTPLKRLPATDNPAFKILTELGYLGYFFFDDNLIRLEEFQRGRHPLGTANVQNFVFLHPRSWILRNARRPFRVDSSNEFPLRAAS